MRIRLLEAKAYDWGTGKGPYSKCRGDEFCVSMSKKILLAASKVSGLSMRKQFGRRIDNSGWTAGDKMRDPKAPRDGAS